MDLLERWIPYLTRELLIEKDKKSVTLDEIIAYLALEKNFFLLKKTITIMDKELIVKCLNDDDLYFADYIFNVKEDKFETKKYEPFQCEFYTSGKIIVENDLREFFNNSNDFNVNYTSGIIQTMDFYAKQGMLHGFVGNSSPTLFLSKKNNEIYIGAETKLDEEGEYTDEYIFPDDSYEDLSWVCTDLWWYSIVDLETFEKNNPDVDTSEFEIVEIPKGTWILTHKYGISSRGYHEDLPYATMKLKK